jgi:hypothetical protein
MLLLKAENLDINESVTDAGVQGVKRLLSHLDMLDLRNNIEQSESTTIYIEKSSWSAMFWLLLIMDGRTLKRCSGYHYGSFWSV